MCIRDRSPSKLYLEPGSSIKVRDAINALIIKSANDVATVVSENISGSEKEFAKLMTSYAKKLGMNNTTFAMLKMLWVAAMAGVVLGNVAKPSTITSFKTSTWIIHCTSWIYH